MKKTLTILTALWACASTGWAENYQAGNLPEGTSIHRVLSAGAPADVLLLAVAPEKLPGLASFKMDSTSGTLFPDVLKQLPTLGKIAGKGSTLSAEKILALKPDLIVDVGNATPNYVDQANRTFAQTKVPYLLLDGKLADTPRLLRELGARLGNLDQAERQAQYAEETLAMAASFAKKERRTVYLARNADGLQSAQPQSIHTEAMELVGLKNVVEGANQALVQVSMEQLLLWDPEIILTQYDEFYQQLADFPAWQSLSAVKNHRVFFVPHSPFGWLDSPPSINRLLGVRWLQHLLSGKENVDFVPEIQRFYKLFYHIDLSTEQAQGLFQPQ